MAAENPIGKRYVLWQRAYSPMCIVGSIRAANIVEAANLARGMYGSFHVTEWDVAQHDHRTEAERMDAVADQRQEACHAV